MRLSLLFNLRFIFIIILPYLIGYMQNILHHPNDNNYQCRISLTHYQSCKMWKSLFILYFVINVT